MSTSASKLVIHAPQLVISFIRTPALKQTEEKEDNIIVL